MIGELTLTGTAGFTADGWFLGPDSTELLLRVNHSPRNYPLANAQLACTDGVITVSADLALGPRTLLVLSCCSHLDLNGSDRGDEGLEVCGVSVLQCPADGRGDERLLWRIAGRLPRVAAERFNVPMWRNPGRIELFEVSEDMMGRTIEVAPENAPSSTRQKDILFGWR